MVQKNKIYTKAHVTQQLKYARGKKQARRKQNGNKKERGQTTDVESVFTPGLSW